MKSKIISIVVVTMFVAGLLFLGLGITMGANIDFYIDNTGFHFSNENLTKFDEQNFDHIKEIEINMNTTIEDIEIVKGETFGLSYVGKNLNHKFEDGKLTFSHNNQEQKFIFNPWHVGYGDFSILTMGKKNQYDSQIKIYIPSDSYIDNLNIQILNCDIYLNNLNVNKIDIIDKYGNLKITDTKSQNINADMASGNITVDNIKSNDVYLFSKYGDINLSNMNVSDLQMESQSGNVIQNNVKSNTARIFARYGDIKLNEFSTSNLNIEAQSGNVNIKGDISENADIISKYGDVILNLFGSEESYSTDVSTKYGDVDINGKSNGIIRPTQKLIKIRASSGNVKVKFEV